MKKHFKLITMFLLLVMLVACGKNENPISGDDRTGVYSNISDEKSQLMVKGFLEKAGIPSENIARFLGQVEDYNKTIGYTSLTKEGFEANLGLEPEYDTVKMMDLWEEKKGMFIGNNCRMTTFELMEGLIGIGDEEVGGTNLFMDLDAIEYNDEKWDEGKIDKFKTLYGNLTTEDTKDIDLHIKKFKDELGRRNIKFKEGSKASQISVVFHDTLDSVLFIGHAGVLLDIDEGLIFIEKLNFSEPYQAIKFKDRLGLNDYLMNKYDVSYGQPEAKPFIMENEELLEGYRPNQNNLGD